MEKRKKRKLICPECREKDIKNENIMLCDKCSCEVLPSSFRGLRTELDLERRKLRKMRKELEVEK